MNIPIPSAIYKAKSIGAPPSCKLSKTGGSQTVLRAQESMENAHNRRNRSNFYMEESLYEAVDDQIRRQIFPATSFSCYFSHVAGWLRWRRKEGSPKKGRTCGT